MEINKNDVIKSIQKSINEGVLDESIILSLVTLTDPDRDYIYAHVKDEGDVLDPRDIVYGKIYMVTYISPGGVKWLTNYTDYLLTIDESFNPFLLLLGDADYDNTTSPIKFYCGGRSRVDEKLYSFIRHAKDASRYETAFKFCDLYMICEVLHRKGMERPEIEVELSEHVKSHKIDVTDESITKIINRYFLDAL